MIIIQLTSEELDLLVQKAVRQVLSSHGLHRGEDDNVLFDIEQAAAFLGLAKPTLYAHTSKREIPHLKKGKKLYFEKEKLREWLQEGKQKTQAEIQVEAQNYVRNGKGGKHGK